jgi:thiol-disulfide isomerase/thioredoxin
MNSKRIALGCILIVGVLVALAVLRFRERSMAAAAAAKFESLVNKYNRLADAQSEALAAIGDDADATALTDAALTDEEWMSQGPGANPDIPNPDAQLLPEFLDFAKQHPNSPFAFDALFFVVLRGGPQTAEVHGAPWQAKEEALEVAWDDHAADPRIIHLFELLGGSLPSQRAEAFLKRAIESASDRTVRAAATFHLARYYHSFAKSHERSAEIAAKPQLINFERYWKVVISPYLENFPIDRNKTFDEIDQLLATVVDEYPDVPATDWKWAGPTNRQVETVPFAEPKKYADLARSMMFAVNNITPGQPAPEIIGTDAEGKTFRLSDYRGKVVLLTFTADWCSDCLKVYPVLRSLVEKYRGQQFVLLSVNRDDTLDELKSSIASGQTTWRCWWDGRNGPINESWNNGGIPDLYLLDHEHIIQDVALARFTSQEEFERAIEPLLQKAPNN